MVEIARILSLGYQSDLSVITVFEETTIPKETLNGHHHLITHNGPVFFEE
jgi:hypothetical protein